MGCGGLRWGFPGLAIFKGAFFLGAWSSTDARLQWVHVVHVRSNVRYVHRPHLTFPGAQDTYVPSLMDVHRRPRRQSRVTKWALLVVPCAW